MAGQSGPIPTNEEPESVVQPRGDGVKWYRPQPSGGELDRQRNAVQSSTDSNHRWRGAAHQRKPRLPQCGPLDEQPDRFVLSKRIWRRKPLKVRNGEGWNA